MSRCTSHFSCAGFRAASASCNRQRLSYRQRSAASHLSERSALDKLGRQVMLAIRNAKIVNRHDVRMLQMSRRAGFRQKPVRLISPCRRPARQNLEGHDAFKAFCRALNTNAAPSDSSRSSRFPNLAMTSGRSPAESGRQNSTYRVSPTAVQSLSGYPTHRC